MIRARRLGVPPSRSALLEASLFASHRAAGTRAAARRAPGPLDSGPLASGPLDSALLTSGLLAAALLAAGCRSRPASGPSAAQGWARAAALAPADIKGSCDKRAVLSQCTDFAARAFVSGEKFLQQPCGLMHGNFTAAACPGVGRIGSCAVGSTAKAPATTSEVRRFYAGGPNGYDAARAQHECQAAGGVWLEPHSP